MANNKIPRQILNRTRENSGEAVILSAGALEKGVGNDAVVVEPMKGIAFIFRNYFFCLHRATRRSTEIGNDFI